MTQTPGISIHLSMWERKVTVLREAGEPHLPQDCCSHQLAFSHVSSFTWQALRAICAGITDAQQACRAIKHQIRQVFYYGSTESKGGTQIPAWGRQQEGGESRISGKEALPEHLIIAQHWTKLAGGQVPPPAILASVPPSPIPRSSSPKAPGTQWTQLSGQEEAGEGFTMLCSSFTAKGYTCPFITEPNQDKWLEPLALIHQNKFFRSQLLD